MDQTMTIDPRLVIGVLLGLTLGGGAGSALGAWQTPNTEEIRAVVASELREQLRPLESRVIALEARPCAPSCAPPYPPAPVAPPASPAMEILP